MLVVLVGRVEEWVPGLVGLPLAKVAFIFTVFYAYRHRHTLVPVRFTSLRITKPLVAFFALAIFSITFSIYKSATLQWIQSAAILLLTIFVLVKITQTMRDVERMMLALAVSAVLLAFGVLLNYKGGRAHINGNFDPNEVAYSLDTLLPVMIAVGVAHSKVLKWIACAMSVPIGCAILLTGSLGGAIGFGVVVLVMSVYPISLSKIGKLRSFSFSSAVLTLATILAVGVSIWSSLPASTTARLSELTDLQNNYNAGDSKTSRLVIWRTQLTLAVERPIGYGMGTAAAADGRLGGGAYFTSHNSFIEAFVELGALGLWLFLYTYYITWKQLGMVLRKPHPALIDRDRPKALLYVRGLRIALIGNAVAGFFLSEAYSATIWMTVAVCAAFVHIATNGPSAATSEPGESGSATRKWRASKGAPRMNRSTEIGGRHER